MFTRFVVLLLGFHVMILNSSVSGSTLQIQEVQVPTSVMSGSDVVLRCLYKDIDPFVPSSKSSFVGPGSPGPLYSLKWYKGSHEFYRHYPMEEPPTTVVSWSNFNIEADALEPGKVVLRNVDLEADGSYTCEVSSEGTFHTDTAVANLTVIDVRNVEISLVQDPPSTEIKPGDRIRWNCTFGRSRPRAQITWLINGEQVSGKRLITIAPSAPDEQEEDGDEEVKRLEWSSSVLDLTVAERHFKNQWMKVSCVAQIVSNSTYRKMAELRLRQQSYERQAGDGALNNPSPVLGPSSREQPSMAKIAGSHSGGTSATNAGSIPAIPSSLLSPPFLLLLISFLQYYNFNTRF